MADYATLLRDRVMLAVRSVDRIFRQGYVPHLQTAGWCARFLRDQRGFGYPSSAVFGEVGRAYEAAIRKFAAANAIPVIGFAKGDDREQIARDHLDTGRPDCVSLTFGRRINARTAGPFRTKVITDGVDPQISCYYKASRMKQYFQAHRALRTQTVICDTRDFGIGRRVCLDNWNALRAAGEHASQRLCDAEAADAHPAPDTVTFAEVTRPTSTAEGLHAPALRFGDPRVIAVLAATLRCTHLIAGFDNRSLTQLVSALLGVPCTSRHATYDLRRPRRKQIIERTPRTHRHRLTPHGRATAVLFTKTYGRLLTPALTALSPTLPEHLARRSALATTWRQPDRTLAHHITAGLAAA